MDIPTRPLTPLRQRMLDDMRMRKMADNRQIDYVRAVRKLAAFLVRSPDTATVEDLRRFQLHLVDCGTSPTTINATLTGLKFFFVVTLERAEVMARIRPVRVPRTLPTVLSREEAARLIACTHTQRHPLAVGSCLGHDPPATRPAAALDATARQAGSVPA